MDWEDSPGGGHGNPLQHFCLENAMDTGASWATVHRVGEKSRTRLKELSCTHTHRHRHTQQTPPPPPHPPATPGIRHLDSQETGREGCCYCFLDGYILSAGSRAPFKEKIPVL